MRLVKNLGTRLGSTDKKQSWGLFWCIFCKQEIEKELGQGKRDKSCGCHINIKHGEYKTRLYNVYHQMKGRCLNYKNKSYKDYGGRGIKICNEWKNNYIIFRDWAIQNGYNESLQIDRINNDGNYEPNNCRFVTRLENMRNRRNSVLNKGLVLKIRYKYNINYCTQRQLAKEFNIDYKLVNKIVNNKIWLIL